MNRNGRINTYGWMVLLLLFSLPAAHAEDRFTVELFRDPTERFRTLIVTFKDVRPTGNEAEIILRRVLDGCAEQQPNRDIKATVLFCPMEVDESRECIELSDGSTFLYYDAAAESVFSEKQLKGKGKG